MTRIRSLPYFSHLCDKEFASIQRHSTLKKYDQNDILFYEGESARYLYILLEGSLKVYQTTAKANNFFILFLTKTGELIGEFALFSDTPYPNTAQFVTQGEVLQIDFKPIKNELLHNPELNLFLIKSLSNKQRIFLDFIHSEMFSNSEAKVVHFLLHHETLFSHLKRIEIASILNMTPETLSRMLSKLKKLGLIQIEKDYATILIQRELLKQHYQILLQT